MKTISWGLDIPEKKGFDLIVCGGGIAGCAAALSGARMGRRVLLLEKSTLLGGLATIGLVNYFVPMCNHRGRQVCRGMAEEFLRLSIRYGYSTLPDAWKDGEPQGPTSACYQTEYDPWLFAMQLAELLDDAGVEILFDCTAAHPLTEGGRIAGIVTDSTAGFAFYPAKQVIDATGDGEIAAKAGAPTVDGRNYFSYFPREITLDSCRAAVESGKINRAVRTSPGGSANLYGGGHPEGMPCYVGASAEVTSRYLLDNQRLIVARRREDPGRDQRELVSVPMMPQFRTIRRLDGDYTLREDEAYIHFDDSVAAINDFDRADYVYEVPLRCLTRRGFPNLTVSGRCASADGYAWDVVRVIPPAILTGQAAAVAAARAMDEGCAVSDVPIRAVQEELERQGAGVHFDDSLVPASFDRAAMRVQKR